MGNSFNKEFFCLHCLHCNLVFKEPGMICCPECNNILISPKIDENINFSMSNYKKNIIFIEKLCEYTKKRILYGYNYIQTASKERQVRFTFREYPEFTIEKPIESLYNHVTREMKINYFCKLISFYNNLLSYNYQLYEAILANSLIFNMYNNFSIKKIEDNPPSYENVYKDVNL